MTDIQQVFHHYVLHGHRHGNYLFCPFCGQQLAARGSGPASSPTCTGCGFVQYRNPAPAVSVLIVDGDRVVLGRRRGQPGRGTWALPSGYVEVEDSFLATAVREAREETGLQVRVCSILNVVSSFVSPRFHFLGIYVAAQVIGGALAAGDDLDAVQWIPLAGPLPDLGFPEDRHAIDLYARGHRGLPVDPRQAATQLSTTDPPG
jgi:ADP-ribose pyrophosphatase YjhB (NUDIX family)